MMNGDTAEKDYPTLCEIREAGALRAACYRALSAVFAVELDEDQLAELVGFAQDILGDADGLTAEERKLFQEVASVDRDSLVETCRKLRTQYAQLFVGPRHKLAAPFESVYYGNKNRLFTEATDDVRKTYQANGFQVAARNVVPDDFIAYELEFMASLAAADYARVEEALRGLEVQERFLDRHLLKWAPAFTDAIVSSGVSPFYGAWATYLAAYLKEDRAALSELLELFAADEMAPIDDVSGPSHEEAR